MSRGKYSWGLIVLFFMLAPLCGCPSSFSGSSSESHFLTACEASCPGELECLCGVCTQVCEEQPDCNDLSSSASCIAREEIESCSSGGSVSGKICQVECSEDEQCEHLGSKHECVSGLCLAPEVQTDGEDGSGGDGEAGSSGGGGGSSGGGGSESTDPNQCLDFYEISDVDVKKVEKVDLFFVIDNSGSMKEEQEKLRVELPRMIMILTTGDLNPDDGIEPDKDFTAVKDLHLAVVDTDMGLPGVRMNIDPEQKCKIGLGDDGKFRNQGNPAGDPNLSCQPSYPLFLSFTTGQDPNQIAAEFQCTTALGMSGCGFEMQLEAPLKALWPANPVNLDDSQQALNIIFFGNSPPHGDQAHIEFLRNTVYHPTQSDQMSVLGIVLVTDEEDCSAGARGNLDFLEHPNTAPAGIGDQPANLRCYYDRLYNEGNQFPVQRYINGFKALRPGYDHLVVFAAIAGVPPSIKVDDYDSNGDGLINQQERDSYYQAIFSNPLMQERIRADGMNLEPSCTLANQNWDGVDPDTQFVTKAYPARRITEVAAGFGDNGVIQSICQENFTGAMDSIIQAISKQLGGVCLPLKYKRNADGLVECDVIWGMPGGRECDLPFLSQPPADEPQQKNGKNLCLVNQVRVIDPTATDPEQALAPGAQGWYYDDFSQSRLQECAGDDPSNLQRISFTFTAGSSETPADPPAGATVELRCRYRCDSDADCAERGNGFCDLGTGICVTPCTSDADCPDPGWTCDADESTAVSQQAGYAICVKTTCE